MECKRGSHLDCQAPVEVADGLATRPLYNKKRRVELLELDAFQKPPALTQVAMDKFSKTWLEPETGKMLD